MTHVARLATLTEALAAQPLSVSQAARLLRWPVSSVWLALHELLKHGKVVFHGYIPNPAPQGGSPQKLYRLADSTTHPKPQAHEARQPKNAARTHWKPPRVHRSAGSGVIAGPITIGKGSKWGAGSA
jgi:hypothetical protein